MMEIDDQDSAKCQNWGKKGHDVINEKFKWKKKTKTKEL